jgi:hypothetical protein
MIPPEKDSRWFPGDDRFTAGLKLFVLFLVCELADLGMFFLIPVYIWELSANAAALPVVATTLSIAVFFALKYQMETSRDGTGRGGSPAMILYFGILLTTLSIGLTVFFTILDLGILKIPGRISAILVMVLTISFAGLCLYYWLLTGYGREEEKKN